MSIFCNDFCRTDIEFMSAEELKHYCTNINGKNIIVILSATACKRYGLTDVLERMEEKYNVLRIEENVSYPTQETLLMGVNKINGFDADVILVIGGGSSIDFAKAMKFLIEKGINTVYDINVLLNQRQTGISVRELMLVAVPTTAGTGAELTKWATVWDIDKSRKYSIEMEELKPDKAIIVPELTAKADQRLTLSAGLDSLSHALEAYWSKRSTPLVRALARQSAELTVQVLGKILEEPQNLQLRERQCLACLLSGMAFSVTRTTACHAMSYPLTMNYKIEHGIAVAMTLAQTANLNKGNFKEEDELFSLFTPFGGIDSYLKKLCEDRISLRLRDYKIVLEDIPDLAEGSFTIGRMDNNPVDLNRGQVENILYSIF